MRTCQFYLLPIFQLQKSDYKRKAEKKMINKGRSEIETNMEVEERREIKQRKVSKTLSGSKEG